ncbi:MAG: pentapeptide repeat-containing protein [Cyanobacteria bacterium P01_C01_bin.120]
MAAIDFQKLLNQYRRGERQFQGVTIEQADGFECDLREIELTTATINAAYLPYSNFGRANLRGLVVKQGNFGDAKLGSCNLAEAKLAGINLSRADLRYACLRQADLRGCDLRGADLTGADLTMADLSGADLTGANLFKAQLLETCLVKTILFRAANADLAMARCDRSTILPDGHYYS